MSTWLLSLISHGSGQPQVVAGFSPIQPPATPTDPAPQKPYQVATAIPTGPSSAPIFGTELPQFEGNFYNAGTIAHPNFEFAIRNFSAALPVRLPARP